METFLPNVCSILDAFWMRGESVQQNHDHSYWEDPQKLCFHHINQQLLRTPLMLSKEKTEFLIIQICHITNSPPLLSDFLLGV